MATFNTTLQLDEPAEIVDARIAAALSKLTSSRARSQPGLIVITREYRPTWAVVLAIIGFFFFLLGLLFLLVKTTERLTISISSRGEEACTVVMAGEADDFVIVLLQSALATPTRECPNCKHPMKREASVCPSCRTESNPWIHHAWSYPVSVDT
jgi:hypothetical protein